MTKKLKSDQNGIEIHKQRGYKINITKLKSDQNGIEMGVSSPHLWSASPVKIRPKWDWNSGHHTPWPLPDLVKIRPKWDWNLGRVHLVCGMWSPLKSDQNGIEMHRGRGPRKHRRDPLKSDQNGIEMNTHTHPPLQNKTVKIRPKWDWNKAATSTKHTTRTIFLSIYPIVHSLTMNNMKIPVISVEELRNPVL